MALLAATSILAALVASASTPTPVPASIPAGAWGGVGLKFVVDSRGATVELDAAHGSIGEPIVLDGRFESAGSFVRERPGPTRAGGEDAGAEPARYRGTVAGDTLTLDITLTQSATAIGPFHARRGASARLRKMV